MCVAAGTIAAADIATAEPVQLHSVFLAERSSEVRSHATVIATDIMTTVTTDIGARATIGHVSTTSRAQFIVSAVIAADAAAPTRAGATGAIARTRPDQIPSWPIAVGLNVAAHPTGRKVHRISWKSPFCGAGFFVAETPGNNP